jgi:hypothetical protein
MQLGTFILDDDTEVRFVIFSDADLGAMPDGDLDQDDAVS